MPTTNFEPQKPKLAYLPVKQLTIYLQRQSMSLRINFHLFVCALKIQRLRSRFETQTSFTIVW